MKTLKQILNDSQGINQDIVEHLIELTKRVTDLEGMTPEQEHELMSSPELDPN